MEPAGEKWMLIVGNLALKQVSRVSSPDYLQSVTALYRHFLNTIFILQLQATVLGLLASMMAALLGLMAEGQMPAHHVLLLCSASVSTAFIASLLQGNDNTTRRLLDLDILITHLNTTSLHLFCVCPGIIMVGVIIGSHRLGINPDNVATPMAASFGDLITLALLACLSQWFYSLLGKREMKALRWSGVISPFDQQMVLVTLKLTQELGSETLYTS